MKLIERDGNRVRVRTVNKSPSKTSQEFKEETNVNNVLKRYQKTGIWPGRGPGQYADFSEVTDLLAAQEVVQNAQDAFSTLPSSVRKKFANDPSELINWIQNPENYEEAQKLGLIEKKVQAPIEPEPSKDEGRASKKEDSSPKSKKTD